MVPKSIQSAVAWRNLFPLFDHFGWVGSNTEHCIEDISLKIEPLVKVRTVVVPPIPPQQVEKQGLAVIGVDSLGGRIASRCSPISLHSFFHSWPSFGCWLLVSPKWGWFVCNHLLVVIFQPFHPLTSSAFLFCQLHKEHKQSCASNSHSQTMGGESKLWIKYSKGENTDCGSGESHSVFFVIINSSQELGCQ